MSQINNIIQLNVELEGLLRVAEARPSAEAIELAKEKFSQLADLFSLLDTPPAEEEFISNNIEDEIDKFEDEIEEVVEEVVEEIKETPTVSTAPTGSLLKTFTINDKFLFRRELFDGSEADFVDTLNLIEAMSSLDEAREYLFCDLGWDSENEMVVDFVNIMTNYFKND